MQRRIWPYGPAARDYAAAYYYPVFDVFFPVSLWVFGLVFLLWITRTGARFAVPLRAGWRLAALAVPTAFFALDLSENIAISRMLTFGDDPPRAVVEAANFLTITKSAAGAFGAALAVILPRRIFGRCIGP